MYTDDTYVADGLRSAAVPLATLPAARGVLAVVARPGDASGYLGAVLDAFHLGGTAVNVLALTGGESPQDGDTAHLLDLIRCLEFDLAASMLGAERRFVIEQRDTSRLAGHLRRVVRECDADLLVSVGGQVTEAAVARAGIPALGWTLPPEVARSVRRASGLAVTGNPRVDIAIRVRRSVQRRAMRAHRSQVSEDRMQLARLAIQGNREWLRWLVP